MKHQKHLFSDSLRELTVTKNLVLCGLMVALALVLNTVASITIGPYIRIGFSGLPNRIVEFLFGPAVGCIFGGTLDLLKYFLKPSGGYFPGFTASAMLGGVIYGCAFYKKAVSLKRVILAEALVKVFINCGLNTLWLTMLYGEGFFVLLPLRILKNIIMLPIDCAILFFALTITKNILHRRCGFAA